MTPSSQSDSPIGASLPDPLKVPMSEHADAYPGTIVAPVTAHAATRDGAPNLSVIVPCYNSSAMLRRCLTAMRATDYDDYEVLIVDDGSTEDIESIVREFGYGYMRIDGPGGPALARNRGVERVRGRYVVFVDADCCVHPDTLRRFAEAFAADPSIDSVMGAYDNDPADPGFVSQYKNLFHHYVHQANDGDASTFWAGCGAIRRDVFLKFGGFDEVRYRRPAIEDIELGTWMHAAGYRIVLDRRVQCQHLKRWTLMNLLKTDIFDRGIPWTRLMKRAGALADTLNVTLSQRISVALACLAVLALPVGIWYRPALWIAAGGAALLTMFNVDFYRYFARHRGAWFAIRSAPLHWLYLWYCGLSFVLGTLSYYLSGDRGKGPMVERKRAE